LPTAAADRSIDVDFVPIANTKIKINSFAIVVGIETYRDLPLAEFAVRDAKVFKQYLIRAMGFPEENVVMLLNSRATKGDIEGYLGVWLKNNAEKDSFIIFYYAGHGAPNPSTGEAFIIPFDGNPAFPEASGIPIKSLYSMISSYKARETLLIIDSCFSGAGGRSVIAKGGRPALITVENPSLAENKIIVMTASSGSEISSSYPEKRHGLFTYFVLKGLQGQADINSDKTITIRELYTYVTPNVKKIARGNNKEQTPTIMPGIDALELRSETPLCRVVD